MLVDMLGNYMKEALVLAFEAYENGEVPVGAVIVKDKEIIGRGRNRREQNKNALSHAEIEAIEQACLYTGDWRLSGCDLYVTLEPCPMCAGAIINSRIDRLIYGAADNKAGAAESIINLFALPFNHKPQVIAGIMEKECGEILAKFFKGLRHCE